MKKRTYSIVALAAILCLAACEQAPDASGHEEKSPLALATPPAKPISRPITAPTETPAALAAQLGEAKAMLLTGRGKQKAPEMTDRCAAERPTQAKDWSELGSGPIEQSLKTWRGHSKNLSVYKITPLPFEDIYPAIQAPTYLKLYELRSRISSMMHNVDIAAVIQPEKGPRTALLLRGCEAYNKVLNRGDLKAGGKRHFFKRAKAYLRVAAGPGARTMMRSEDEDDKEHKREKDRTVNGWLFKNMRKFHRPLTQCRAKGCELKYYAWRQMNGVLYYESIKMDPNGRITEHKSRLMASGLGAFSVK